MPMPYKNKKTLAPAIKKHGYKPVKHGDGFELIIGSLTHYVTTFKNEGRVKIWGYYRDEDDEALFYDTGTITVTVELLDTLLELFLTNHRSV